MRKLLGLLLLSVFMIGCGQSSKEMEESNELTRNIHSSTEKINKDLRKLIKDASLRFRTEDISETNNLIKKSVTIHPLYRY